jgi:putative hydrolase
MSAATPGTAAAEMPAERDWNRWVAARLREISDLLTQQGANPFRAGAYARAAGTLEELDRGVDAILAAEGLDGLTRLPNVGRSIAASIAEMVRTGRWSQLERIRGTLDPVKLFQSVPGIGPTLALEIHNQLHADTLEALEAAAYDGRLAKVAGIGPRRLAVIRHALAAMLARRRPQRPPAAAPWPPVTVLLDVDREYREKAEADRLPKIQPRRFAAETGPWLPILHTQRGDWHFTALYSNTPRAHQLGRTRDWVVIYFHSDSEPEGQCTVVTEHFGPLSGMRVVRGREKESGEAHAAAVTGRG